MKTKAFSIGIIFLVLMVCTACTKDEAFISQETEAPALKNAISANYIPGTDITEQLKTDIEAGVSITLPPGHFYLSETILTGYTGGTIKGSGKGITVIESSPGFKSSLNPRGAPVTCMINVLATGDVFIKSISFKVSGNHPAEGHENPFTGYSTNIDNVIVIRGIDILATIQDVSIEGAYVGDIEGSYRGYNISFPLIGVGLMSPLPLNMEVKDCQIYGSGGPGIEFYGSDGGFGVFKDNLISNSQYGIWLGPRNIGSVITVKNNEFHNIDLLAISRNTNISDYCFKDNELDGTSLSDDCQ